MKDSKPLHFFIILTFFEVLSALITSPAIITPTSGEASVSVSGLSTTPSSIYFALRMVSSTSGVTDFVPYYQSVVPMSSLRMLSQTGTGTETGTLASYTWSAAIVPQIQVWEARSSGWGVSTLPSGSIKIGPLTFVENTALSPHPDFLFKNVNSVDSSIFSNPSIFPNPMDSYGMMMASRIFSIHSSNADDDITCRLRIKFSGLITSVYISGKFVGKQSSIFPDGEAYFITEARYPFKKGDFEYLQIYGYQLTMTDMELIECKNSLATPLAYNPVLEIYSPVAVADLIPTIPSATFAACSDTNCNKCNGEGYCYECNTSLSCLDANYQCNLYGQTGTIRDSSTSSISQFLCFSSTAQRLLLRNFVYTPGSGYTFTIYPWLDTLNPLDEYFVIMLEKGGIQASMGAILPRDFTAGISAKTLQSSDSASLSMTDYEPVGSDPVSLLYAVADTSSILPLGPLTLYVRVYNTNPTTFDDYRASPATIYQDSFTLTAGKYYVVTAYFLPGTSGSQIGFKLKTSSAATVWVNGASSSFSPSAGDITDTVTASGASFYVVTWKFVANAGTFSYNPNGVFIPLARASPLSTETLFYFEHHLCAPGRVYDPTTYSCQTSCPEGFLLSKQTCYNPCKEGDASSNCLSGSVTITTPTVSNLCNQASMALSATVVGNPGTLTWTAVSNSSNDTAMSELNAYLATQTTDSISIPKEYLEAFTIYTFTASFILGTKNISDSYAFPSVLPIIVNIQDDTCICPASSLTNPVLKACGDSTPTTLTPTYGTSMCDDTSLVLTVNPKEELYFGPVQVLWYATANTTNLTAVDVLNANLSSNTSRTISVYTRLLEPFVQYTVYASYVNVFGVNLTSQVTWQTSNMLQASLNSSGSLTVRPHEQPIIPLVVEQCLLGRDLLLKWEQTGGPFINVQQYVRSDGEALELPRCALQGLAFYQFQVSVYYIDYPSISYEYNFLIQTESEPFRAIIMGGDRDIPVTDDLRLTGTFSYQSECKSTNFFALYQWTCQKSTSISGPYTPCSDSSGLFNTKRVQNTLTVPSSYYSSGEFLKIGLIIDRYGEFSNTEVIITVQPPTAVTTAIICENCIKYSKDRLFDFEASISDQLAIDPAMTYTWSITPSSIPIQSFVNRMKAYPHSVTFLPSVTEIVVTLNVAGSGKTGKATLTLPLNQIPSGGSIVVTPTTGFSLETLFELHAKDWVDDDAPISYQYLYSLDSAPTPSSFKPITNRTEFNRTKTFLPGTTSNITATILLRVFDPFNAEVNTTTTISLETRDATLPSTMTRISTLIGSTTVTPQVGSYILGQLADFKDKTTGTPTNGGCPTCSGNGICENGVCICNPGFGYLDCSLPLTEVSTFQSLARTSLVKARDTFMTNPDVDQEVYMYQGLRDLVKDPYINNEDTFELIQDVLENALNFETSDKTLKETQYPVVLDSIDSMIRYASYKDCTAEGLFTTSLVDRAISYIEKSGNSTLHRKIPSEEASTYSTSSFSIYTVKASPCDIEGRTFGSGSDIPTVKVQWDSSSPKNCSKMLDVKYYVFDKNLFSCSYSLPSPSSSSRRLLASDSDRVDKSHIAFQVSDSETGQPVEEVSNVNVKYPTEKACEIGCSKAGDGSCSCPNPKIFDIKGQIYEIFRNSNINKLANFNTLLDGSFTNTIAFWVLLGLTAWLPVTWLYVKYVIPDKDALKAFKKLPLEKRTLARAVLASILVVHPMLNIYFFRHKVLNKQTRAVLYYVRIVLLLTFSSIFQQEEGDTDIKSLITNINIMSFIFPFFTVMPISAFLDTLIRSPTAEEKKEMGTMKNIIRFMTGFLITAGVLGVCIAAILIIADQQTADEQAAWTFNFVLSFVQDLFLNPVVMVSLYYVVSKIYMSNFVERRPKLKKIVGFTTINNEHLAKIQMNIKDNHGKVYPQPVQEDSIDNQNLKKKQGSLKIPKSKSAVDRPDSSFEFDSASEEDSLDFGGDQQRNPVARTRLKKMKSKLVETSSKLKEIVLLIENEQDEKSALTKLKDFLKGQKQQAKTFEAMGKFLNLNVKNENQTQATKLETDNPTITISKPEETAQTQHSNGSNFTTLLRKRINTKKTTIITNKDLGTKSSIGELGSAPGSIKNLLGEKIADHSPLNTGRDNPETPTNLIKRNGSKKNTKLY